MPVRCFDEDKWQWMVRRWFGTVATAIVTVIWCGGDGCVDKDSLVMAEVVSSEIQCGGDDGFDQDLVATAAAVFTKFLGAVRAVSTKI